MEPWSRFNLARKLHIYVQYEYKPRHDKADQGFG